MTESTRDVLPLPRFAAFVASLFRDDDGVAYSWRRHVHRRAVELGHPVYVAEVENPEIASGAGPEPLSIVDTLTDALKRCDRLILVLIPRRQALGSPVRIGDAKTAVSYIEIETVCAMLARIPISLLVRADFSVDNECRELIPIFGGSIHPGCVHRFERNDEIAGLVEQIIQAPNQNLSAFELASFVKSGIRARRQHELSHERATLFLGDQPSLAARTPRLDLVSTVLDLARDERSIDQRLSRLWIARRELGVWEVTRRGAPTDPLVRKLLADALAQWASASAWMGLHGYLWLGQIEALSQLALLTSSSHPTAEHSGGLSSAYYSSAKLLRGTERLRMLMKAMQHTYREHALPGDRHGVLAVRASIYLQMGNVIGARMLYRKVLDYREAHAFSADLIAEARVEWAFSLAVTGQPSKALHLIREDLAVIERPGFRVRALRKAAIIAKLLRRQDEAVALRQEAESLAKQFALRDQLRQMNE
mgnify:CR=1 FL=1